MTARRREFLRTLAGAGALAAGLPGRAAGAWNRPPSSQDPLGGLGRYIDQALRDWRIPGAAVAVVRGDQTAYLGGHGVREIGDPTPVDPDTLFQVGSTSKAFTTAALGVLVDEGRLRWDDPVLRHLPDFQLHDPWLTRNLTVRDTVTHRSGFRDFLAPALEILDPREAIRRMRYAASFAPFRDSYTYSNLMFGVAGQVAERAGGSTWGELVKHRLFEPLGMTRSGTSPYEFWDRRFVTPTFLGTAPAGRVSRRDARDSNVAMPHTLEDGPARAIPWQSYDTLAAAGAVVSSAGDLAKWLVLHLGGGRFQGRTLLSPGTVAELHAPQNVRDPSRFPFDEGSGSYTLGWHRDRYRGELHLSHGGGILGFPAFVFMLPRRRIGVVVLANGRTPSTDDYAIPGFDHYTFHKSIALWVFDRLLGAPPGDWRAHYLAQVAEHERRVREAEANLQAARLPGRGPSLALSAFAGAYEDRSGPLGRVVLETVEGRLRLRFAGEGAYAAHLDHWHQDVFRIITVGVRFTRGFVEFSIGPDGRVAAMRGFGGEFTPIR